MRYLAIIWTIICIVFVVFISEDIITFAKNPSTYPIGNGDTPWFYHSNITYFAEAVILILWLLIPCVMLIKSKGKVKKKWLFAHILITLTYQIIIIFFLYNNML